MMRALPILLACALLCTAGSLRAQRYSLKLHRLDGDAAAFAGLLNPPAAFPDQAAAFSAIQRIVPRLQEAGYLTASVDSLAVLPEGYEAFVYLGKAWRWARLSLAGIPAPLLAGSGITEGQYADKPLSPASLGRLTERLLGWCEDNGYPFARVWLDSVVSDPSGGVYARLAVETGSLRRIDSVIIEGDVKIAKAYLMRYLGILEGGLYNESDIRRISARLRDLPYLQEGAEWRVALRTTDTKLYLRLKERRANLLHALIGLQPNTVETGRFLLTADARAAFQNILGNGESCSFSYQKLQAASPRIQAEALYPFLLGTAFGAEGHFDLYFKGTQFRRTTFDIGGRYALNTQDFLRAYYRSYSNRIIEPDTAFIVRNRRLPDDVDIRASGGGLELQTLRTDSRVNPARGWGLRLAGEALRRGILKNDGISGIRDASGFDYGSLYDTGTAGSTQYQLSGDAALYLPLHTRIVLKNGYAGGWISGPRLFRNELFQVGGFRLLRGFDEGSLFVNQYHILTTELRYILGRASNVYLFSDNAWLQSRVNGALREGLYNGFGAGAQLDTRSGQFSIAYALGRSPQSPVQLRQSRVHVGYVAYF